MTIHRSINIYKQYEMRWFIYRCVWFWNKCECNSIGFRLWVVHPLKNSSTSHEVKVGDIVFNNETKINIERYFLENNINYSAKMTIDEILYALGFEKKEEKEEVEENTKVLFSKYQRKRK